MENLIEITRECFIVKTQAGYKKLLKKLGIHFRENDNRRYNYEVTQLTEDESAIEEVKYEFSNRTYTRHVKYPIKYPCIVGVYDNTFELEKYYLTIRYFDDDLCNELKQIVNKL